MFQIKCMLKYKIKSSKVELGFKNCKLNVACVIESSTNFDSNSAHKLVSFYVKNHMRDTTEKSFYRKFGPRSEPMAVVYLKEGYSK